MTTEMIRPETRGLKARTVIVMTEPKPETSERGDAASEARDVDPVDLLRAMLAISPEDAASAREDAAKASEQSKHPTS